EGRLELELRRKPREQLDFFAAHGASAEEPADDLQGLERPRLVDDALRELDLVAGPERDGGGSGHERAERAAAAVLGRAAEQAVLHDVVLHALRTQLAPQALELGDGETAVLGHDDRGRARELIPQALDGPRLRRDAAALALRLRARLDLRHVSSRSGQRKGLRPSGRRPPRSERFARALPPLAPPRGGFKPSREPASSAMKL